MKNKTIIKLASLSLLGALTLGSAVVALKHNGKLYQTNAASLPNTIDLNDSTQSEIKEYYSSLSSLSDEERSGTNLLKNLKGIISKNVTYFSYDQVGNAYVITDRDWKNSPASEMSGYDSSTNKITSFSYSKEKENNPYVHLLYCDYSAVEVGTRYKGDGDMSDSSASFDQEHCWSQSHGFSDKDNKNISGAGTDLHHLIAGTQYGNRTLHNNYSYGFVKANDGDWSDKKYETKNKRGEQLFKTSEDQQNKVFEPQDCDKGDIARALLYMVACYNNYDGSVPTQASPALELKPYVISEDSTGFSYENIANGYYGNLKDILAWHRMDPVDEYEIHRNNIIFKNYQHNRNPFIDYPQWVDYIWGTSIYDSKNKTLTYDNTSTGHADLSKDEIYGYDGVTPITPDSSEPSDGGSDSEAKPFDWKMIAIIAVVVVVVIIVIIGVAFGVLKVNKKGQVKVKKSGVKKVVKKATKSKKK